ncbi:MAG: type II toxin-antitoxin system VapC family toxin [Patescibacteria group bacterium]|mgnify:FL=1
MSILIDSDIIIDFLNNQSSAVNFFKDSATNKELFMSVISWIEVVYGFKKNKASNKIVIFQNLLEDYRLRVISIDEKVAKKFLDVKIGLEKQKQPLADFDLLIAATAIANNLSLVTRNTKHFKRIKDLNLF